MENNTFDERMRQLSATYAAAQKKLILGIVFSAVGYIMFFIELVTLRFSSLVIAFIIFLLALVCFGIGVPFFIIGLIDTRKTNRQITLLRGKAVRSKNPQNMGQQPAAQQPATQQPVAQQPLAQQFVAQQPVAQQPATQQPATQQPATQQPATQQPAAQQSAAQQPVAQQSVAQQPAAQQPAAQQPAAQQPVAQQPVAQQPVAQQPVAQQPATQQSADNTSGTDTKDLNWEKYSPLEAGVTYNPSKNYKFHRAEGFAGSIPQNFINTTFPKCPICCSPEPYWLITQHNQMSWKGNLYLFKCSRCDSIISMSMPDVTTLGKGGVGFAANASVGLANLAVKASSGKEAGAVYAVIESVGHSGVTPQCQGKEFKLEQLQEMSNRA